MTVSTELSHEEYVGNGVTTDFDFRFRIFESKHLVVVVADSEGNEKTLKNGTDYTIVGAGSYHGGKVVLNKPLAQGWKILLERDLPVVQETDLRNQGKFFAEVHEDAFDYLTMLIQKALGTFSLSLRKPTYLSNYYDAKGNRIANLAPPKLGSDSANKDYVDNSIKDIDSKTLRVKDKPINALPNTQQRANKMLAFDDDGQPITVLPESGSASEVLIELGKPTGASLIGTNVGLKLSDFIDNIWKTISLDYFVNEDGNFLQTASDWCKENGYALVIPKGKTYQYSERVIFEDITLLWEGTLELIQPIDCGIVFRRNVTMPTYGYLKTSKTIVLPDDYYMVGFYSWKSPDGSLGCQDNIISGRLDIRNGNIDYDGWDQGNVDDYSNLTGGGVLMLGGSWLRPSLGVDESSWENVHRNDLKFYVDGFSYALTLQGIYDSESVNEIFGWVNGNTIDIRARRARKNLQLLQSNTNGMTNGGEVSANIIICEFQSDKKLIDKFIYCEGNSNKFIVKGWDIKSTDGDILIHFSRGNKPDNGTQESINNIIEMMGATLNDGEGVFSKFIKEDKPGLNKINNTSFAFRDLFLEHTPYALNSRLSSQGYIRHIDNFFGNFALRPKYNISVYRNGSEFTVSKNILNKAFDGNLSTFVELPVISDDKYEIVLTMQSSYHHFALIGSAIYHIENLNGYCSIEALDVNDRVIYKYHSELQCINTTGTRNLERTFKVKYTFSKLNGSNYLRICSLFSRTHSHDNRHGMVGSSGGDISGHLRFLTKEASPVITDQKTGQLWEIQAVDGVIKLVAYYP
ncbi:hypothetical protein RGI78_001205 [Proteus mirabilis]|nr:hypothetical protein [Proteus mirabilis]HBC8822086.1 hypothetical protein [Proteus mirabilis]HCZ8647778.1 hypothetical protein [Proteus mirabilis]HEK2815352.1 hypothetical protein [Proteus mirabilis]